MYKYLTTNDLYNFMFAKKDIKNLFTKKLFEIRKTWYKDKLLQLFVKNYDIIGIKYLYFLGVKYEKIAFIESIKYNNGLHLYFLKKHGYICGGLDTAAKYGHIELVDFFLDCGEPINSGMVGAAKSNNINLIKYLEQKGGNGWKNVLLFASYNGNIELMNHCIEKTECDINTALSYAIKGNQNCAIEFLLNEGGVLNLQCYEMAIQGNNEKYIQYFLENEAIDVNQSMIIAANSNNLTLVKKFVSLGAKPSYCPLNYATRNNNMEMLLFLWENGNRNVFQGLHDAAVYNHKEIVDFFLEKDNKYTFMAYTVARINYHFELANYIYEKFS